MKQHTIHSVAALLLLAGCIMPGCSNDMTGTDTAGTGTISLQVSTAQESGNGSDRTRSSYDPMDYLNVRIYNASDELIRRYTEQTLPERLELLAGSYSVDVKVGEQVPASFYKKFYQGSRTFPVTAGVNTPVEVKCLRQNVRAEVVMDPSVAEHFGSTAKVWIAAGTTDDYNELGSGTLDELNYLSSGEGFFMLPEGVTTLIYKFRGTHNDTPHGNNEVITLNGILTNLEAAANCRLTFRYSEDAPGYIECFTVLVDDSTDDVTDDIIWTDISISGDGFDVNQQQEYIPGVSTTVTYNVVNLTPIKDITLYAGGQTFDLYEQGQAGSTGLPGPQTRTSYPGIEVIKKDNLNVQINLSDDFFTAIGGGEQTLRLRVRDTSNGELSRSTPFLVQGLIPVGESDYDLWSNSVTLRALVLDPAQSSVSFRFGDKSTSGTPVGDGIYTATFGPEWRQIANTEQPTYPDYYQMVDNTGVAAGKSYSCEALIGGRSYPGSFTTTAGGEIPNGDMEGNLSCFTTSNTSTTMWGSGNNSTTNTLCLAASGIEGADNQCAKLSAGKKLGILASGNLFTGTFKMNMTNGTVGFGQKYTYTARPKSLKFKYHATVGNVDVNKYGTIPTGNTDISCIYVAIVDWSARHEVTSGTSAPSGTWDPGAQTNLDGSGAIIAYGMMDITSSTPGSSLIEGEIPLRYFDTEGAAPTGKYTLVISCSTSKYGDFMNGCSTNVLYVDSFTWGY